MRILLFLLKAVSALAYVYILGYLAAGGTIDATVWVILLLGALIDLVPEALTVHSMHMLPETAQKAEWTQLVLAVFAYILLAYILFGGASMPVFPAYAAFAILWIASFLIQESVFFYLGDVDTAE